MTTATRTTPEITRAAERYLEQYGDPLVMNTYLKITILALSVACIALAAIAWQSQQALAHMHPLFIRIKEVGESEAIDYRNFSTVHRKQKTSITSPVGRSCTSAAIASPSSATRPTRSTSSTATCSGPSSSRNGKTTSS